MTTSAASDPLGASVRNSGLRLILGAAVALAGCGVGDDSFGAASVGELQLGANGSEFDALTRADADVPAMLGTPDVVLDQPGFQNLFFPAGDVDGDGFGDWATLHSLPASGSFLLLRYGGRRPASPDDATALSESGARLLLGPGDARLEAVTAAGDVDGDGYGDVLVTPYSCFPDEPSTAVHLLYGGPERLEGTHDLSEIAVRLVGPPRAQADAPLDPCLGGTAAMASPLGDFDGDGLDDLAVVLRRDQRVGALVEQVDGSVVSWGPETLAYFFYGRYGRLARETRLLDADAIVRSPTDALVFAAGDANGDGRGDLLISGLTGLMYWVPGRSARFSGELEVSRIATPLDASPYPVTASGRAATDLDGDGLSDVFLQDPQRTPHLFYGRAGLFEDGIRFSEAEATLPRYEAPFHRILDAGDRDGDGDRELVSMFYLLRDDESGSSGFEFALLGGLRERLRGQLEFPTRAVLDAYPAGRHFDDPDRYLSQVREAGDLDGDGAADLLVSSTLHRDDHGCVLDVSQRMPQLHIVYGTPLRRERRETLEPHADRGLRVGASFTTDAEKMPSR